ncbi:uncharacterized protein LY79DRAFT_545228 [Colletotrichum navitas]|uniref:Uncharacterized protein n=1 Tax=Colletotrichum navitas TaxID=681940 RepID=A0AAD8Q564_9PEZI|nr:uncharacterized protein LY79DRAFT_545228 [Colletotrichum navitas]KAK1596063.1 hypothetical protein LY79DRAFT_545228 [Colletotrichum navitas]
MFLAVQLRSIVVDVGDRWARIEGWRNGGLCRVGGAARRNRVPFLFILSLFRSLSLSLPSRRVCFLSARRSCCLLSLSLSGESSTTQVDADARDIQPPHTHSIGAVKENTRKREQGGKIRDRNCTLTYGGVSSLSLYPRFRVSSPGPVQSSTIEKEEQKSLTHRHTHRDTQTHVAPWRARERQAG